MSVTHAVRARFGSLLAEAAKFGVVGMVSAVIDVGLFNVFRVGLGVGPLTSKTLSVVVATTFAYFANRHWSFRHRARTGLAREYLLFFVLNGVGLGISLACLAFSHYVLGFTHPIADNISANVIGLGLGTLFRFWAYRKWVFLPATDPGVAVPEPVTSAA